jgi:hypothetical protein
MGQEKCCGKRVRVIRELRILMRHDAELAPRLVSAAESVGRAERIPVFALSHTGAE